MKPWTPAQEATIRRYVESVESEQMQRDNWLAAMLRRDGRSTARDLLAEIDRLRALPVLSTCGECGWARDGGRNGSVPLVLCGKQTTNSPNRGVVQPHAAPPPPWCPLRPATPEV